MQYNKIREYGLGLSDTRQCPEGVLQNRAMDLRFSKKTFVDWLSEYSEGEFSRAELEASDLCTRNNLTFEVLPCGGQPSASQLTLWRL